MVRAWVWLLRAECALRDRSARRRAARNEATIVQLRRDIRALPEIEPERIVPW